MKPACSECTDLRSALRRVTQRPSAPSETPLAEPGRSLLCPQAAPCVVFAPDFLFPVLELRRNRILQHMLPRARLPSLIRVFLRFTTRFKVYSSWCGVHPQCRVVSLFWFRTSSSCWKETLPNKLPCKLPISPAPGNPVCIFSVDSPVLTCYVNRTVQLVTFCVSLFSLDRARWTFVRPCISIWLVFVAESYSLGSVVYPFLPDRRVGCLHLGCCE